METKVFPWQDSEKIKTEIRQALELLEEDGFRNEIFFQMTGSNLYLVRDPNKTGRNQIAFGRIDEIVEEAIKKGKYTDKDGIEHQVPTDPNEKRKLAQAYYKRMLPLFSMMNLE